MKVIKGRNQKSLLVLEYIKMMEGREILIVESENLTLSKMVQRDDVHILRLGDNSIEDIENALNVLDIGFEGEDMKDVVVVFYLNTTLSALPMIEEFERRHGITAIVTLQTDGELGEFTI